MEQLCLNCGYWTVQFMFLLVRIVRVSDGTFTFKEIWLHLSVAHRWWDSGINKSGKVETLLMAFSTDDASRCRREFWNCKWRILFLFFLPKYKKRASKKDSTSARWDGRDFFAVIGAASQGRCPRWALCKNILIVRLNCHPKRGKLRELLEEGFKKNWVHFGQTIYELEFQT